MRRWLIIPALAACVPAPTVTWHADVRPVVATRCLGCHTGGWPAGLDLDVGDVTWDEPPAWAAAVADAVTAGRMPPWTAEPGCHPLADGAQLADAERAVFAAWADDGLLAGEPDRYVAPPTPDAKAPPDLTLSAPAPVRVLDGVDDDYACVLLPLGEAGGWYRRVQPRLQPLSGHHTAVFLVPPELVDDFAGREPKVGPGAWCLTGVGPLAPQVGFGGAGIVYPEGPPDEATWLPPGGAILLQAHYARFPGVGGVVQDAPAVDLWRGPDDPAREVRTTVFFSRDIFLPAGAPDVTVTASGDLRGLLDSSGELSGVFVHMHGLGVGAEVRSVFGEAAQCLLRLDGYDEHAQINYSFPPDRRPAVVPTSTIEVDCRYDNSAGNQPFRDGVQQAPRDVRQGESASDEMCAVQVSVVVER